MVIVLALATSALRVYASPSEFDHYPPEPSLSGPPVTLKLATPESRRFRSVLRSAAAAGPNFNGHYRIAEWGCGTGCASWAIIDLQSGSVWMSLDDAYAWWSPDIPMELKAPDRFEARVGSSLLYVHVSSHRRTDRTLDTRKVFVWERGALRLLRTEAFDY
jgi:hypothetical protein